MPAIIYAMFFLSHLSFSSDKTKVLFQGCIFPVCRKPQSETQRSENGLQEVCWKLPFNTAWRRFWCLKGAAAFQCPINSLPVTGDHRALRICSCTSSPAAHSRPYSCNSLLKEGSAPSFQYKSFPPSEHEILCISLLFPQQFQFQEMSWALLNQSTHLEPGSEL